MDITILPHQIWWNNHHRGIYIEKANWIEETHFTFEVSGQKEVGEGSMASPPPSLKKLSWAMPLEEHSLILVNTLENNHWSDKWQFYNHI